MNKENFDQLLESMREGAAILRGEQEPSRRFIVERGEDAKIVRKACNVSQTAFAKFMGVSVGTLRNWEQGRRRPTGAARVLLSIAMRQPDMFRAAMRDFYPELATQ